MYIGDYAFVNCPSLTQINILSAKMINRQAFYDCKSLNTIQLGLVAKIGEYAFGNCYSLETLNYEVIDLIDNYAFINCSKLGSITTTVCSYSTFQNCSSLSKVILLTNSSTAINNFMYTFSGTPMLKSSLLGYYGSIYVPQSMLNYYRINYASYSDRFEEIEPAIMSNYILAYNHYSKTVSLSEINTNAKYILNHAFHGAVLTDGNTLSLAKAKYIGGSAFYNCSTLTSLDAANCEYIGDNAFAYCTNLSNISLPKVYSMGNNAFYSCSNLKVLSLPNLVGSFNGFNGLEELYLDNASEVTVGTSTLKVLSAPKATYWAGPASAQISYLNLPQLSYLKMSSNGTNYGANLLSTQLASEIDYFNIGASFVYIVQHALQKRTYGTFIMSGTSTITYAMLSQASIGYAEFLSATTIENYAFNGAIIGSISLPKVKTINSYAFANVSLATNLSLPEVTYLGNYALQGLHGCSELIFPKLSTCGQYAFQNVSVSTLKINAGFSLGTNTYLLGSTSITNIVFNSDITYLRAGYQLAANPRLTRVIFTKDILDWGTWYGMETLFANTPITQSSYLGYFGSIYVPASLLTRYQSIFSTYYNRITTIEAHEAELRELGLID